MKCRLPKPISLRPTNHAWQSALHRALHAASLAQQKTEGRVALRRLNQTRHENTLNDPLGVSITLGDMLPDDGSLASFDNASEALDVSSTHLVRYHEAADGRSTLRLRRGL